MTNRKLHPDGVTDGVRALLGIQDLILNSLGVTEDMHMVNPNNLYCLLEVVSNRLRDGVELPDYCSPVGDRGKRVVS